MFESLKKKLKTWLGSEEKPKETKKKSKEKPAKKDKKVKPTKETKTSKKEIKSKKELPVKISQKSQEVEELKSSEADNRDVDKEEQESAQEETEKKPGFFSRLFSGVSKTEIKSEDFEEIFAELELILLENNVNLNVVDTIKENLSKKLIGMEVHKDQINETIKENLKESIAEILIEPPNLVQMIKEKKDPFTIIFFGINGSGKTTSVAKVADFLKRNGISSVLAAGDTFRAASIEQLTIHAQRLGIKVISQTYGADPAAVAFDAKNYAQKNNIQCVLIDTAGRMYTKENLIKEMEKIIRVIKPDLKIFVGESITGNDATEQAKTFNEAVGIDGIILTKADVDDKGGAALSVSNVTHKPIFFLGMGQEYKDLKVFKKEDILNNLGLD